MRFDLFITTVFYPFVIRHADHQTPGQRTPQKC